MWPWEISRVDDLPDRPASMRRNAKHQFLSLVGRALLCRTSAPAHWRQLGLAAILLPRETRALRSLSSSNANPAKVRSVRREP